ncbi:His/Glu/Gln/Arg/opine family amino acid ABC transporter permease subunit [Rhizobium leguminosarum]|nr:His/Glu/Gln/Arg/opine family amino acid ABC transporter permease subunit [Rhizobium leguminosarum]
MNVAIALEALITLPRGLTLTLALTFGSLLAGFAISVPLAFLRASSNPWASAPVLAYTYAFRGTPLLVQLFLIYYGVGQLAFVRQSFLWTVMREPFWCAFIAFTLNSTAHTTEVLRGGIQTVPLGQIEAAKALGLSRLHAMRLIVFPLAIRIALPAYVNEVIGMLKASSLASTITLLEITGIARQLVSETFAPYEVFIEVAGGIGSTGSGHSHLQKLFLLQDTGIPSSMDIRNPRLAICRFYAASTMMGMPRRRAPPRANSFARDLIRRLGSISGAGRMNRNSGFHRDFTYDRRQLAELVVGQRNQFRKVDLDPIIIRRHRADPAAVVDAVFVRVVIDFKLVQQIDGEAPEYLGLPFQLICSKLVFAGENVSFQFHDDLNPRDCRLEPFDQAVVKLAREITVAAEAVCEDDEPEAGKPGVEHEVVIGCHDLISFVDEGDRPLCCKEGPRTAERGSQAGEPIFSERSLKRSSGKIGGRPRRPGRRIAGVK